MFFYCPPPSVYMYIHNPTPLTVPFRSLSVLSIIIHTYLLIALSILPSPSPSHTIYLHYPPLHRKLTRRVEVILDKRLLIVWHKGGWVDGGVVGWGDGWWCWVGWLGGGVLGGGWRGDRVVGWGCGWVIWWWGWVDDGLDWGEFTKYIQQPRYIVYQPNSLRLNTYALYTVHCTVYTVGLCLFTIDWSLVTIV